MMLRCCVLLVLVELGRTNAGGVRFGQPQFMGPGERPDSMVGLDSVTGERVIGSQLSDIAYRGGTWVRQLHPLPKGVVLPTQCGYPCHSIQTMPDTYRPLFERGDNVSAENFVEDDCQEEGRRYSGAGAQPCKGPRWNTGTWSVAPNGTLTAKTVDPQQALRSFSGLPVGVVAWPCCGPKAEKFAFRTGGATSVKINASYYLQTVMFRFSNGRKEYNHTHIPTSIVAYSSTDLIKWQFLSVLANSDDYPESEEGPNEMDMVVLKSGSLLSIVRMDAGDGKDHPYLPYYETRSTDSGTTWTKLTPVHGAGSARPKLLVLEGAVLLSGGPLANL